MIYNQRFPFLSTFNNYYPYYNSYRPFKTYFRNQSLGYNNSNLPYSAPHDSNINISNPHNPSNNIHNNKSECIDNYHNIEKNESTKDSEDHFSDSSINYFELLGFKLYFDDILLISLLFFLYNEEVKDHYLFMALILLLMS